MPPKRSLPVGKDDGPDTTRDQRNKRTSASSRELDEPASPGAGELFDIGSLEKRSLNRYSKVNNLILPMDARNTGLPRRYGRAESSEHLKNATRRHWPAQSIREADAIVTFLYAAKNQDRTFKLRFADNV
ncbi:hypothetical protein PYCC9005_000874 [Savitreella phatthalungensis]